MAQAGVCDLCRREEPLSVLEAGELGLETTVLMAKARESFVTEKVGRGPRSPMYVHGLWPEAASRSPTPALTQADPLQTEAESIITSIFFPLPPQVLAAPTVDSHSGSD